MRTRAVLVAALCTGVAAVTACGSSVDQASSRVTALGLTFTGTYAVTVVPTTLNGVPVDPAQPFAAPATFTWVVQSACAAERRGCVAIAATTTPVSSESVVVSSLATIEMGFVFENGAWTRAYDPPPGVCLSGVDGAPVEEPWAALHLTDLGPTDTPTSDAPLAELSGHATSIQGGTCSGVVRAEVTLTRTGDVPAGTAPPTLFEPAPRAKDPAGAVWRGTYDETTIPKSTTVGDVGAMKSVTTRFAAVPHCSRDGGRCMIVLATAGQPVANPPVFDWVGNAYERSSVAQPVNCAAGGTGTPRNIQHFEPLQPGPGPSNLTGTSTREVAGDCSLTAVWDVQWTRVGD